MEMDDDDWADTVNAAVPAGAVRDNLPNSSKWTAENEKAHTRHLCGLNITNKKGESPGRLDVARRNFARGNIEGHGGK